MTPEHTAPNATAPTDPRPAVVFGRVEILDGLRGLAVALVVVFHVWQVSWLDYTTALHLPFDVSFLPATGFFGVDLFFFLSAFCLTLPYAKAWREGKPAPTLRHFVTRRAAKILPSYYLALFLFLWWFPDAAIETGRWWFHVLTHVFFAHTFWFETSGTINGVLWSLATEVQFYVIFPLLLIPLRRAPAVTVLFVAGVAVAFRWWCLSQYGRDHDEVILAYRDQLLPARLDVFAAGMAAACVSVWARTKAIAPRTELAFALGFASAFGVFVALMKHVYEVSRFDVSLAVATSEARLPTAITLFAIGVFGTLAPRFFQKLMANPATVYLSLISYNLYLWHQPIARWLADNHLPPAATPDPHADPRWQVAYTLAATFAGLVVASVVTWGWEAWFLRKRK